MRSQPRCSAVAGCLLLGVVVTRASGDEMPTRPNQFKKWRQETPPKMVVFGDSISDVGRRFNAPASFQFEEYGIGPFPWKRLFESDSSDEKIAAYMPIEGSVSNGKSWPTWLRIPAELNFATSSASATEVFKSLEDCTGITGEGEEFPTATFGQQIDRYLYEIVGTTNETLDHTHVVIIGSNEIGRVGGAITRYSLGGAGYQDFVAFDKVFEVDADTGFPVLDDDGLPVPTFAPMIEEVISTWDAGIGALVEAGVTGRILLANVATPKGLSGVFGTPSAVAFDAVAQVLSLGAQGLVAKYSPQVRMLDVYSLFAALIDEPSIFEDLSFTAGEGSLIADPCIQFNFFIDDTAEIMGTQDLRHPDCQEKECALCADAATPCQNCFEGNPSITKCDDPSSKVFYDGIHFTTDFHLVLAEAIRQCSKDSPDFGRPLVSVLCPAAEGA